MPRTFVTDNTDTVKASATKPGASFLSDSAADEKPTVWKDAIVVDANNADQLSSPWRPNCIGPVASFTTGSLTGIFPHSVTFTDTSTGTPTSWLWDFGDGESSTSQNPTHIYTEPGDYTVVLYATNDCGTHRSTQSTVVQVNDEPGFSWNPADTSGVSVVLSNYNTTFTETAGNSQEARSTLPKSSGKWYFEAVIHLSAGCAVGIKTTGSSFSGSLTFGTVAAYRCDFGGTYVTDIISGGLTLPVPTSGDRMMFAVDLDNDVAFIGLNGTWYGNPVTGTSPWVTNVTGGSGFFTAYVWADNNGSNTSVTLVGDGQTPAYAVPAGYTLWS
jgi:PKD repeat protein